MRGEDWVGVKDSGRSLRHLFYVVSPCVSGISHSAHLHLGWQATLSKGECSCCEDRITLPKAHPMKLWASKKCRMV